MRKFYWAMVPVLLLLVSFVSFGKEKKKYDNPAAVNQLADRIYQDIRLGRTDSLFLHLSAGYQYAGWKKYVPYYQEERNPKLIQQDYRVPFSKCSADEITQSRLMDSISQGWKYWQMWSDSLTNSTWKPASSIRDDNEAYMLGNYTILVVMAHELGHFYANGNGADEVNDAMRENVADHFAMGMLQDLARADKRLSNLLNQFRRVFMKDIYNSVPSTERSAIREGFSLYEHMYFLPMNRNFKAYATMQLVRENIILDLPDLNLRSCLDVYKRGLQGVINGNKIRYCTDSVSIYRFCADSSRFSQPQLKKMYDAFSVYGAKRGVFSNGELYVYEFTNNKIKLLCLTESSSDRTFDLSPIKTKLDSIAGFDIASRGNKSKFSFVFEDTTSFMMYIPGSFSNDVQKLCCIHFTKNDRPEISEVTYAEAATQNRITNVYFTALSAKGPSFVAFDEHDRKLVLQPSDAKHYFTSIIRTDSTMYETRDIGEEQGLAYNMGINFGADTLGNLLFAYSENIKYRKGKLLYTVFVECGSESRGTNIELDDKSMVWSPKYGFVSTISSENCVAGVKIR